MMTRRNTRRFSRALGGIPLKALMEAAKDAGTTNNSEDNKSKKRDTQGAAAGRRKKTDEDEGVKQISSVLGMMELGNHKKVHVGWLVLFPCTHTPLF